MRFNSQAACATVHSRRRKPTCGLRDRATTFIKVLLSCLVLLACGLFAASAVAATAPKPTLDQVGNQVYCQCGCVTTLNHCPHLPSQCQSRAAMQGVILNDIKQGKDDKGILADLVDQYGVRVLASPPSSGFNFAVWLLPGLGLLIGLIIVLILVRRWRRRVKSDRAAEENADIDPKLMAAVEEEMSRITSTKD